MADDVGPEDFTGDLGKGEDPLEEPEPSGLTGRLKYGAVTAGSAVKGLYTGPRDKIYSVAGARDPETEEIDEGRRNALRAVAGATGLLAAGAVADKYSDGELDGNIEGVGGIDGFAGAGPAGNETGTETPTEGEPTDSYTETEGADTPTDTAEPTDTEAPTDTPTDTETPTDTATETPTDTQTATEQGYSGEIDGSSYELQAIPGPVEGQGYMVEDEVLEDYDPDGWTDITDEEEYEALGTAADWYVQQDSIIGVNEPEQISRTFPGNEFGYNTQELYEDIREEAQS